MAGRWVGAPGALRRCGALRCTGALPLWLGGMPQGEAANATESRVVVKIAIVEKEAASIQLFDPAEDARCAIATDC